MTQPDADKMTAADREHVIGPSFDPDGPGYEVMTQPDATKMTAADREHADQLDLIVAAYKFAGVPDPWLMAEKFLARQK